MDKIAVLAPCYNEAKTIGKVVEDFKKCFSVQWCMYMIIILLMIPPSYVAPSQDALQVLDSLSMSVN